MKPAAKKKDSCLSEIQRMQFERDERRKLAKEKQEQRAAEEKRYRDLGNPGDVDFQRMIAAFREKLPAEEPHAAPGEMKICICVRKRPINSKELKKKDHDCITVSNPIICVHDCKFKVDGITKYLDNVSFKLDHVFHEDDTSDDIYMYAVQPFADFVLRGGRATVFACNIIYFYSPSIIFLLCYRWSNRIRKDIYHGSHTKIHC
jgi:kinesin family protein 2/24